MDDIERCVVCDRIVDAETACGDHGEDVHAPCCLRCEAERKALEETYGDLERWYR